MAEKPSLNYETLESLRAYQEDGEPDFLTELIDAYLGDAPSRILSLKSALAENNGPLLAKSAHALKGASSNLGAEKLAELLAALEKEAKGNRFENAAPLTANILSEFELVEKGLSSLRK